MIIVHHHFSHNWAITVIAGIEYFYEGSIDWPENIPKIGPLAERGCVGCAWYDVAKWQTVNDIFYAGRECVFSVYPFDILRQAQEPSSGNKCEIRMVRQAHQPNPKAQFDPTPSIHRAIFKRTKNSCEEMG